MGVEGGRERKLTEEYGRRVRVGRRVRAPADTDHHYTDPAPGEEWRRAALWSCQLSMDTGSVDEMIQISFFSTAQKLVIGNLTEKFKQMMITLT